MTKALRLRPFLVALAALGLMFGTVACSDDDDDADVDPAEEIEDTGEEIEEEVEDTGEEIEDEVEEESGDE